MSDLPQGWEWASLGDIASSVKNGVFVSRPGPEPSGVPILRISAVRSMRLDSADVRYTAKTAGELREQDALLQPGDLLFTRYSGSREYVGVCARVPEGIENLTYPDKLIRVRVPGINSKYLAAAFASPQVRSSVERVLRTTAGQIGIAGSALKRIRLPIAPLTEQQRIVTVLEDHLSRLDGGGAQLALGRKRLTVLAKRAIVDAVPIPPPAHWSCTTVGEAGAVDLGRQRHPDWHTGPNMRPYLRVANVFEDRIDLHDIKEMDFPPDLFERFKVRPGEILLNEGQSPEYLGRPAMYRGEPDRYAFTNSLLRFRANPDVLPEWALLVFRRHMHAGRFVKEVRITTNIAHLSATRFKSVEFPIPPLADQERILGEAAELLAGISRLDAALCVAQRHSQALRRSLMAEAFAGRLVPQTPSDEPAAALLERIRSERAAQPRAKRRRAKNTTQETLL